MNRRDALKTGAAAMLGMLVPKPKLNVTEFDKRIAAELMACIEQQRRKPDGYFRFDCGNGKLSTPIPYWTETLTPIT